MIKVYQKYLSPLKRTCCPYTPTCSQYGLEAIEKYGEDPAKIDDIIATYDKARQNYYNYHTCQKWGDYRNYNLSINSSYITEEEAVGLIVDYVERRTYR